ncbi:MAG: DMT family transporter [Chloroflexi bacterium]|nr:MAG: DMT family transporter [Chloroflexota bacterium]MBL1196798.1 DMT family transporter [Chloroflexota bacterium]NOH14092.1 DMT family transporter [Chloroflexota bacterium]
MQGVLFAVLAGLAAGLAVGLQGPLSSLMSQRIGPLESTFIIHIGGAILAIVLIIFLGSGNLGQWRNVPWYALAAGTLGVLVVTSVSYSIPRLGAGSTVTLMVVAQLIFSAILDHNGWLEAPILPFESSRLLGMALLLVGTWLMVARPFAEV